LLGVLDDWNWLVNWNWLLYVNVSMITRLLRVSSDIWEGWVILGQVCWLHGY